MTGALLALLLTATAPQFEARDLAGETISSSSLEGRPIVFNFWMTGCGPCVAEIDELNTLTERHDGVRFVAVAVDSKGTVERFVKRKPFKYRQVPDGARLAAAFGVVGYPTHAVVDARGNLVAWFVGGNVSLKIDAVLAWLKAGSPRDQTPELGEAPQPLANVVPSFALDDWPGELRAAIAELKAANKTRIANALLEQLRAASQQTGYWPGMRIIAGRVTANGEDPRKVDGPGEILEDGWFAAVIGEAGARFVLPGYDPVFLLPEDAGETTLWVGTLTLHRLAPSELSRLDGRVVLPARELAKVRASLSFGPSLNHRGGWSAPVRLEPDGSFSVKGLSPTRHCLKLEAAGWLGWERCVELSAGLTSTLAPVTLEPERAVRLTALPAGREGFDPAGAVAFTVKGGASEAWDGPTAIQGQLWQNAGRLYLRSVCDAQRVGSGAASRWLAAKWNPEAPAERRTLELVAGSVYLLQCDPDAQTFLLAASNVAAPKSTGF